MFARCSMKRGGTKAAVNHREGCIMREERPLSPDEPMDGPNMWSRSFLRARGPVAAGPAVV
jgi:hypothetical protein